MLQEIDLAPIGRRHRVFIYQIFYDEQTKIQLDPGFIPLKNIKPERPDWYEYWPIRSTLLDGNFDDEDYLGFFSPRFSDKTRLSSVQVDACLANSKSDVISFSPYFDFNALYPNSFHQGEEYHPGFLQISQDALRYLAVDLDLMEMVQDQTRIIFSNYFVAKFRFWKRWLELTEQIFALCETGDSILAQRLNTATTHRQTVSYSMKIFLIERLVSVLLEVTRTEAEIGVDLARAPLSLRGADKALGNLVVLDALKGQYIKTKSAIYRNLYIVQRQNIGRLLSEAARQPSAAL